MRELLCLIKVFDPLHNSSSFRGQVVSYHNKMSLKVNFRKGMMKVVMCVSNWLVFWIFYNDSTYCIWWRSTSLTLWVSSLKDLNLIQGLYGSPRKVQALYDESFLILGAFLSIVYWMLCCWVLQSIHILLSQRVML